MGQAVPLGVPAGCQAASLGQRSAGAPVGGPAGRFSAQPPGAQRRVAPSAHFFQFCKRRKIYIFL